MTDNVSQPLSNSQEISDEEAEVERQLAELEKRKEEIEKRRYEKALEDGRFERIIDDLPVHDWRAFHTWFGRRIDKFNRSADPLDRV